MQVTTFTVAKSGTILHQINMLNLHRLLDIFLPSPDGLLANMRDSRDLIIDLLNQLPSMFEGNKETGSALGPALQAALKLMVGWV